MLMHNYRPGWAFKALAGLAMMLTAGSVPLKAQSLSTGGLTATVLDERGKPLTGASVTLEKGKAPFLNLTTNSLGVVTFFVVPPGKYSLLIEQLGYRPLRNLGVVISGGVASSISVKLAAATPGNTVDERPADQGSSGGGADRTIAGQELHDMDRQRAATDASRGITQVDPSRDGHDGFATSADGQRPTASSLVVDGMQELLLRHGGLKSEPASAPLFARDAFDAVRVLGLGADVEWPSVGGALLAGTTRSGSGPARILPWLAYSGSKLGGKKVDNPADSSGSSFEGGLRAYGAIKGDTGAWAIRAEYRQSSQPSALPFEVQGGASDPTAGIKGVVQNLGHGDISSWLAPTVRTWKGGDAMARFDWQFNARAALMVRAGMASWSEDNPLVGNELVNGAGGRVESKDVSLAAVFAVSGDGWVSESRLGFRSGQRDWTGSTTPYTGLVGEGIAIGSSATVPGHFKDGQIQASEAYTIRVKAHTIKGVFDARRESLTDDWLPYGTARFEFGDVASFAAGRGAYLQASRSGPAPAAVSVTYPSLGLEDAWQLSPQMLVTAGARLEAQKFPKGLLSDDTLWLLNAGVRTSLQPIEGRGGRARFQGGMEWKSDAAASTTLRVDAAMLPLHLDLSALNEAVQNSGSVLIRRATGALAWPFPSGGALPPVVGPALTFFNQGVKSPRAFKGAASLTHRLAPNVTMSAHAAYDHTDYQLRRTDLNLVQTPLSSTADGRPIFGTIEQYGSLLTPSVGSNRRFHDVDMAYLLSSSGFTDYSELGVSIDRQVSSGLSMSLSYTWSHTRDNLPGQLSNEVADQLSPFPGTIGSGSWDNGRSDFDVPNRAAATVGYVVGGTSISARFRYRSGLPFTPGFARGVDANGDGAVGNDPASLGSNVTGLSELAASHACLATSNPIAVRNSCRDPGVRSLDLHLGVALPLGRAHPVSLLLDAFNVVSSDVGLFDHAADKVDPAGSLSFNGAGRLVLPLIANTNFGQLVSRRSDPRVVRIGFRVEN